MKKFHTYSEFLNESQEEILDTKEKIAAWLDSKEIKNYTINDDLTVDVDDNVNLSFRRFRRFPVKFGNVTGHFPCSYCTSLTSLEGCPESVSGNFYCSSCANLISLEGCPGSVGGGFYCTDTIFEKPLEAIGKDKTLEIFGGSKPASKENQELLVKLSLEKKLEWNLIEPWLDKETIEKYKTTLSLNKLGF